MNKKFLSVALFGALLALAPGTFTSCKDYDDDINSLTERVEGNEATFTQKVTELQTKLDQKATELQKSLDDTKTELNNAKSALTTAQNDIITAKSKADQAQTTADQAVAAAQAAQAAANAADAAGKQAAATAKAEAIQEALSQVEEARYATIDSVEHLLAGYAKIERVEALEAALGKIKIDSLATVARVESLETALEMQKDALEEYKEIVDEELAGIESVIESLQNSLKDKVAQQEFDALKNDYTIFKESVASNKDLQDLESRLNEAIASLAKNEDVQALREELSNLQDSAAATSKDLKALEAKVNKAIEDITSTIETLTEQINKNAQGLATLNALFSRLTSMVFVPDFYIDGVEAIPFFTYQYYAITIDSAYNEEWSEDYTTFDDGRNTAQYMINPAFIVKEDVKSVKVLYKNAVSLNTRSSEEDIISATIVNVVDGKMTVSLKKNIDGMISAPMNNQNFIDTISLIALQAATEDGKMVTSDWARIIDIPVQVHLFNQKADNDHFKSYREAVDDTAAWAKVPYNQTIDLKEYASAHISERYPQLRDIDLEACGLAIEFNLVEYEAVAPNGELQNQAQFAQLEDGVVTSRAINGELKNRYAVGAMPVIQIILRDTKADQIVDVRYVKIKWIDAEDEAEIVDLGLFAVNFEDTTFACGEGYIGTTVTTAYDTLYTEIIKRGMTHSQFHSLFELDANLYASFEDAKEGNATLGLGVVNAECGEDATDKLTWEVPAIELTEEIYRAGEWTNTVYARYQSEKGDLFIFSMQIKVTVPQVSFVGGYVQTFWNAGQELVPTNMNKSFQINPALTDDPDWGRYPHCSIAADMLKAYTSDNLEGLVSETFNVRMKFDESRLEEMLGEGWTVEGNALLFEGDTAALIVWDHMIGLYDWIGSDSATVAAQKLLSKSVPVALAVKPYDCANFEITLDQFEVNFISPLKLTLNEVNDSFKDLLTGGDTISIANLATVQESFGLKRVIVENGVVKNEELRNWYVVEDIVWDIENIKTNLKKDGENVVITETIDQDFSEFASMYRIEFTADGKALVFRNTSSAHIQQPFQISIPVFVKTKWSPTLVDPENATVVLTINPGDYEK